MSLLVDRLNNGFQNWARTLAEDEVEALRYYQGRGGWFATCSCGWTSRRATYYKTRSIRWAKQHVEETLR